MAPLHIERFTALESALRLWNAKAGGAYQDVASTLRELQRRLDEVGTYLHRRCTLEPARVLERLERNAVLAGETPEAASARVVRQVGLLEEALTDYHIELQTLEAQAERTLDSGRNLAALLQLVQDAGDDPIPAPLAWTANRQDEREAALHADIALLKRELASTRLALDAATAAPRALPQEAQNEIVRLREEVTQLRSDSAALEAMEISPEHFERIRSFAYDENGHRRPLGMILVKAGVISASQLEDALREQRSAWNRHLGALLVDLGYASEADIAQTLAAQMRVPYIDIPVEGPEAAALRLVSPNLCQHHTCVPLRFEGNRLVVAMANPIDLIAQEDVRLATGLEIEVVVATASSIRAVIQRTTGRSR
jgi:hypothetical protein